MIKKKFFVLVITGFVFLCSGILVFASEYDPDDLLDMDIESLMAIEVTSVSKYKQLLFNTPAAVTVITSQDIKQSGLKELPELLRLVPGMQVVRENDAYWHVSARSMPFDGKRKMLVLVDGRSIFSQATGTVDWGAQNYILEDIETIEIIRGPGGTTWGYNAVDGVVNITSKKPEDTQGMLLDVTKGEESNTIFQARFGGKISDSTFYRVYFTGMNLDNFENLNGPNVSEESIRNKGGFRVDFKPSDKDQISIDGEWSKSRYKMVYETEDILTEKFIKGRWNRSITENLDFQFLTHYDDSKAIYSKDTSGEGFSVGIKQFNTELQLDFRMGERNHLISGIGFKNTRFDLSDGYIIDFFNSKESWNNYSFFISDEYTLIENRAWLTLGTKVEHNTNTEYGWQPNIRFLFKPTKDQSVWFAVSRALRAPDFRDASQRIVQSYYPDGSGGFLTFFDEYMGSPLKDEKLIAYEAGYRTQMFENVTSEIAVFYNDYENVITNNVIGMAAPFHWIIVNSYENKLSAYGTEISVIWEPVAAWTLKGSYSYLVNDYDFISLGGPTINSRSTISRLQIQSHIKATENIGINTQVFWNTSSEFFETKILRHLRVDLGMTYKISNTVEISVNVQNLLDSGYLEFEGRDAHLYSFEIPRNLSFNVKVMF
ncbi:MAG: TonB-dependent receptor [Desulfobacteraceae bacterium]|nr:TonB-dependent receptor [Desulfobacteraceae bacterium]